MTSDYERLDSVLLEKFLPADGTTGSMPVATIAQKQIGVRPRVLSVERRKPDRVHLRVLRRLTWSEGNPFAQYYKTLSAYSVADWSEEYFNNRMLFSDYYLLEQMREFPAWSEDPKPDYTDLHLKVRWPVAGNDWSKIGSPISQAHFHSQVGIMFACADSILVERQNSRARVKAFCERN